MHLQTLIINYKDQEAVNIRRHIGDVHNILLCDDC